MGKATRCRCGDHVKTSVLQPVPTSQTKKGHQTRPHGNCQVISHNMILTRHETPCLSLTDEMKAFNSALVETVKFCSDQMILTRHDKPSVDTSTK